MRSKLSLFGLILVLLFVNATIVLKERAIEHGTTVILELAPVDPRSLMQGDYMVLRYALAEKLRDQRTSGPNAGTAYVQLDTRGVAVEIGLEEKPGWLPLRYSRARNEAISFGVDSYFFQEGQGHFFADAKYGELKVDSGGTPILTHLLDQHLRPIAP